MYLFILAEYCILVRYYRSVRIRVVLSTRRNTNNKITKFKKFKNLRKCITKIKFKLKIF